MKKFIILGILGFVLVGTGLILVSKHYSGSGVTIGVEHKDGTADSYKDGKWMGALEKDLPEAPKGFSWVDCTNLKAKFLKPDGWFKTEFKEPNEKEQKCFITKNDFSKTHMLETGLLVVATKDASKIARTSIHDIVYQYIESKKPYKYGDFNIDEGLLEPFYFRTIHTKRLTNISFVTAIGNTKTGTFYTVTYTTPEVEFLVEEKNGFPISGPMTQVWSIDDQY